MRAKRHIQSYEIKPDDYTIEKTISGDKKNAHKIYLIRHKKTNKLCIAKVYFRRDDELGRSLPTEIGILMRISSPTIIKFFGFSLTDLFELPHPTIYMEYKEHGSLKQLIEKESNHEAPPEYDATAKQIILCGIAHGMKTLHSRRVIHLRLKPSNILLDSNLRPCITDFGLAKYLDQDNQNVQASIGWASYQYQAPEVLENSSYTPKSDVYSFGILMYEVLVGHFAFESEMKHKKVSFMTFGNKILSGSRPPLDGVPIKESLKQLIARCWAPNPSKRPTFEEIFRRFSLSFNVTDEDAAPELEQIINDGEFDYYHNCLDGVDGNKILDYVNEIQQSTTIATPLKRQIEDHDERLKKLEEDANELLRQTNLDEPAQQPSTPSDQNSTPNDTPSVDRVSES